MASRPPAKLIAQDEIRRRFNKGGYWNRAKNGQLTQKVIAEWQPKSLPPGEPVGTYSQIISYRDKSGFEIVRVHQYLRPDGAIGASGKPDPKRLFENGTIYYILGW